MRKTIVLTLVVLFILSFASLVLSQEEAEKPPDLTVIYFFKVKHNMFLQFDAAIKEMLDWLKAENAEWSWYAFQVISGEQYGLYIFRTNPVTWEDMDANAEFFAKHVMNFRLNVLPLVEEIRQEIHWIDWSNTKWADSIVNFSLFEVFVAYPKPGRYNDLVEVQNKFHKALVEAEWELSYVWETVRSGGVTPCAILSFAHKSWACFKETDSWYPIVVEAYGEAEVKALIDKWNDAVQKEETLILQFRPDLSYISEK